MTIGAAVRVTEAYVKQRRERAYIAFTNAMTVGMFVASMFSSNKPPTLHEVYPDLFEEDEEAEQAKRDESSAANFLKFANAFNQRVTNGNREPQSQDNG